MDNNNNMEILIQDADLKLQFICESFDRMYLSWEDRLGIYIDILEEKIWSVTQKRQMITNSGINLHIDLYEWDNHLELYKDIVETLKKFKNRCRRDGRKNAPIYQNQ